MSSTVIISVDAAGEDVAVWMPRAWVLSTLVRRLALELEHTDPELADQVLRADYGYVAPERSTTHGQPGEAPARSYFYPAHCDFSWLDSRRFTTLLEATLRAYDRKVREGPGAFDPASAYLDFMPGMSVFKALVRTDSRAEERQDTVGTIFIREDVQWTAPAWIYDMVLEHLEADVRPVDALLAEMLLSARSSGQDAACDLRPLTSAQFDSLVLMTKSIAQSHGVHGLHEAYAPALSERQIPSVLTFSELIMSDRRRTTGSTDGPPWFNWSRLR